MRYIELLNEGGNVFKTETGSPATQRINKSDVIPTVKWLEKLTGLHLINYMLGTTGKKSSSGDLDLGIDASAITKDELIKKLLGKKIPKENIKKSGDSVHLKTPISGNSKLGYVQTDFMFGDRDWMKWSMQGELGELKGMHRHIILSSLARELGMKWSYKHGLVTDNNEPISKNPEIIAKKLLGPNFTGDDISSIPGIIAALSENPNRDKLLSRARENLAKEGLSI